jgi:hypothetical protein
MAITLKNARTPGTGSKSQPVVISGQADYSVCCPHGGTIEPLCFTKAGLVPTRKFHQTDFHIFHDCGSLRPCLIFNHYSLSDKVLKK